VKAAAYKNLGPFIETLQGSQNLSEKLFEHYLKMTDSEVKDLGVDKEVHQSHQLSDSSSLRLQLPSSAASLRPQQMAPDAEVVPVAVQEHGQAYQETPCVQLA
jgi:hypothetical protein